MWYIYIVEYYSALKKNEIMAFASKWMELENMLSEIRQTQTTKGQNVFSDMHMLIHNKGGEVALERTELL